MNTIIKNILLGIITICFISCKDETDLGNNFYYLPDYESEDVGYPYGSILYKSKEKYAYEKTLVYADITSINNNDCYIIVKQTPNKKLFLQNIKDDLDDLKSWSNYYLDNKKGSLVDLIYQKASIYDIHKLVKDKDTEKISDSLFNHNSFCKKMFRNKYNYYIIQKYDDSVLGPLNLKEFHALKKEKKIDLDFEN